MSGFNAFHANSSFIFFPVPSNPIANMSAQQPSIVPSSVTDSVLKSSQPVPEGSHIVSGVDFDKFQGRDITVAEMVDSLAHTGFQGSAVAEAAQIINEMV